MISPLSRFVLLAVCGLCLSLPRLSFADDESTPTRVIVVLSSSDAVVADLEHLVVGLADEQEAWDEYVFANIEYFLIGLDGTRPIFFDQLIDAEHGQRAQFAFPIADLDEFINDSLDPFGIIVDRVRGEDDYYIVSEAYGGWMRIVDDYALFAEHEEDIPEDIGSPEARIASLLQQKGYDAAIQLDNSTNTLAAREAAFEEFRENSLAALKKRPQETNEEFALRQKSAEQSLDVLELIFVQSSEITVGLIVDAEANQGRGDFLMTAVPESDLAQTLQMQAQEHSYFAPLEAAEDSILSGRINFSLDEVLQRQFTEIYPLTRPVLMQQIDEEEGLTADQKAARKEVAGLVIDMLEASGELGLIDAAIEVAPDEGGTHTGVAGLRLTDTALVERIVELLPRTGEGIAAELNVDEAGEVQIHRVTFTEGYPQGLAEFFGASGEFYIGAGPDAVWAAGGAGGLDALKAAVAAVAEGAEGEVDPAVMRLDMQLRPVMQLLKALRDEGVLDLMQLLPARSGGDSDADGEESPVSMFADFEWREAAIEALQGEDDSLHIKVERVDDHLEGDAAAAEGILKAIGELIAKFARENLS